MPGMPGVLGMPSMPGMPCMPGMPGMPGMQCMPGMPGCQAFLAYQACQACQACQGCRAWTWALGPLWALWTLGTLGPFGPLGLFGPKGPLGPLVPFEPLAGGPRSLDIQDRVHVVGRRGHSGPLCTCLLPFVGAVSGAVAGGWARPRRRLPRPPCTCVRPLLAAGAARRPPSPRPQVLTRRLAAASAERLALDPGFVGQAVALFQPPSVCFPARCMCPGPTLAPACAPFRATLCTDCAIQ